MKILYVTAILIALSACNKPVITPMPQVPLVTKTVNFSVMPATDYSRPVYSNYEGMLRLAVYKQVTNPYSTQLLWDTVFTRRPLTQLPGTSTTSLLISKTFPGINDADVAVSANQSAVYYINGNINNQYSFNDILPKGEITKTILVGY